MERSLVPNMLWTTATANNINNNNNKKKNDTAGVYQSDWIYHVELPNLQAGRQLYWYRIVVVEEISPHDAAQPPQPQRRSLRGSSGYFLGETRTFTFSTPPLSGAPTSLALVGDLGQTRNSTRTIFEIFQSTLFGTTTTTTTNDESPPPPPVSQLLIAGDMAYADSDPIRWTSWLRLIEPLARSLPVHVLPGNHEIEVSVCGNFFFCFGRRSDGLLNYFCMSMLCSLTIPNLY